MTDTKKRDIYRAAFTGSTVLLTIFIFVNSATDGEHSGRLSLMITQWLNGALDSLGCSLELSHHAVRKLAHFTEYSALGASLTAAVWAWSRSPWHFLRVWAALLCGAVTAAADEWLQTFIPGRCGCISDALLDFCGVAWAAAVVGVWLSLLSKRKISTEGEPS